MNPVDLPDYSGDEEVLLSPIYEAIWLGLPIWSALVILVVIIVERRRESSWGTAILWAAFSVFFVGLGFVVWGIYRLLGDSRKKNPASRKTQGHVG